MITILGPTACGKTTLAVALADRLGTELISGDSRQVYRRMDLGTGKDLNEYCVDGRQVPYHLIDIAEPGTRYTVFHFQHDFLQAYNAITSRGLEPVFCGGSGLYLESVLRAYRLSPVPINDALRQRLKDKSLDELTAILAQYKALHNTTDVDTTNRAIRAIEIEAFYRDNPHEHRPFPTLPSRNFGILVDRDVRRQRITRRLHARLEQGMLQEVQRLLDEGIAPESLTYYGLEYKFLTLHLIGQLRYDDMVRQLEIAIHQFAKRQMTYFRGMERRGVPITWLDASQGIEAMLQTILKNI